MKTKILNIKQCRYNTDLWLITILHNNKQYLSSFSDSLTVNQYIKQPTTYQDNQLRKKAEKTLINHVKNIHKIQ